MSLFFRSEALIEELKITLCGEIHALRKDAHLLRDAITEQSEITRNAVAEQSEITRNAVAEQADLSRWVVTEQARITRELLEHANRTIQDVGKSVGNGVWDYWKIQEVESLLRWFRGREYREAIEAGRLRRPALKTDHPIAVYSADTQHPRGAKNDNSICPRFNSKLTRWLGDRNPLQLLDLGCAGGGLVRSLIDEGHIAVGLEGSDYPLVNQTGEWGTVPHHLFTCDITEPFSLTDIRTHEPMLFDAVTAWELLEHIPEERIGPLMQNVSRHLAPKGVFIASVATFLDWDEKTGIVWHVTVKPREWWLARMKQAGFEPVERHPFGKYDWLRGGGNGRYDEVYEETGNGFHIVLKRITAAD